jgi:hypothetical protein
MDRLEILRQFDELLKTALERRQEVHCSLHVGNYDEPDGAGHLRNRVDGSVVLVVIIGPRLPSQHE